MGKKVEAKMSKIDQAGYDGAFMDGVMTERGSRLQNTGDINGLIASSSMHAFNTGLRHGQGVERERILDLLSAEGLLSDSIQRIIERVRNDD